MIRHTYQTINIVAHLSMCDNCTQSSCHRSRFQALVRCVSLRIICPRDALFVYVYDLHIYQIFTTRTITWVRFVDGNMCSCNWCNRFEHAYIVYMHCAYNSEELIHFHLWSQNISLWMSCTFFSNIYFYTIIIKTELLLFEIISIAFIHMYKFDWLTFFTI